MELTAEQIEKVQKSLKWVVNQIPEDLGDTNEDKLLKCIRLYCENGSEVINSLKAKNEKLSKVYNAVKGYYEDLDSLAARLQDDYGTGKPFEQKEEDRLGLCYILDLMDEMDDSEQSSATRPALIEEIKAQVRKETATEISQELFNEKEFIQDAGSYPVVEAVHIIKLAEKYGVKVKDE